ncbi:threonine/serine exporter family protein [Radiobacillus kanasensis]|uniref:threonine/serine exporter family protein n=1 Tax=Radiobacillus kanasensis TaxID=2844358 RepID=UPI001E56B744|nr:threonine/serine exporter family protein [Radiobacillus kanasensis]UFT99154.1 threonine/serine exporter family protein [Radiobacillus kanasensis]
MDTYSEKDIVDICLLAGRIMLKSGAETHRVEDTMIRIAKAMGITDSQSYVTPTGILFSVAPTSNSYFSRISERSTDLHKVDLVNSVSRQLADKMVTAESARRELNQIEKASYAYPLWLQVIVAAFVSGCFTIMFDGSWYDFIPALIAGGVGFFAMNYFNRFIEIRFFSEFLASMFIGILAITFVWLQWGVEIDKIIIGSVMPLVPGLLITNAVRDLMVGHLVAGLSKGAEAFLTAFAIGAGIAVVLSFL